MAKITRKTGNVVPPASSAQPGERSVFGQGAQSDTLDANYTAELLRGWGIVGPSDEPVLQDFNAIAFTLGLLISYLHQMGVAEWDSAQEYHAGSSVTVDGEIAHSTMDNNVGSIPGSPSEWNDSGISIDIPGITNASITMLGIDTAIVFDATTETLLAYKLGLDGWFDTGASVSLSGSINASVSAVDDVYFALAHDGNNFLRMMRFDGTAFSNVGVRLNFGPISNPSITVMTPSRVCMAIDGSLGMYDFNGNEWVQAGFSLSISGSLSPSISSLNSSDIAFTDQANNEVRVYRFDGTDFAQIGSGLNVNAADKSIAATSKSSIALVDGGSIRSLQFDGSSWSAVGVDYALGATAVRPTIASSKNSGIVMLSNNDTMLRIYNHNSSWRGASAKNIGINSKKLISVDVESAVVEAIDRANDTPKLDWLRAEKSGETFAVPVDAGALKISRLSGFDVAQVSDTVIRRFSNNGGTWSEIGSGLVAGPELFTSIESIGGDDVACSNSAGGLAAYRHNGTFWTQIGASFTASSSITSMSKIGRWRVACYLSGSFDLVVMAFNGTSWYQDGPTTNFSGIDVRDIASLSATRIAVFDANTLSIICFDLVGGIWEQNGNPLNIGFASFKGLTAINETDVSFIDSSTRQIAVYRFTDHWIKVGYGTTIPLGTNPSIAAIEGGYIAHIGSLGELGMHRHQLAPPAHNLHSL